MIIKLMNIIALQLFNWLQPSRATGKKIMKIIERETRPVSSQTILEGIDKSN